MNARPLFIVERLLIRDTFRQACASGICWMMLAVTALCTLLCLSVSVSGDSSIYAKDEPGYFLPPRPPRAVASAAIALLSSRGPVEAAALVGAGQKEWFSLDANPALARREGIETISGRMTLAFGAISVPLGRERGDCVRFLQIVLAGGIAGTLGLLLALIWTAGFAPTFLEPAAASVLLAKPVARWRLLLGKYLGVLVFVSLQIALFVGLTWLALGVRTFVWDTTYWRCVPLLILQFAVFYSFSILLAVVTRSTVACVFGAALFWLVTWGINYGSVLARSLPEAETLPPVTLALADAAYWVSPKPIDAGVMLWGALDAQHHFEKPVAFKLLESWPGFSPLLSVLSSLLIAAGLLALSAHELKSTDY